MIPADLTFFPDVPTMLRALTTAGVKHPDTNLEWWFRFHAPTARASYRFGVCIDSASLPQGAYRVASIGPDRPLADHTTAPTVYVAWIIGNSTTMPSDAERHLSMLNARAAEHGVAFAGVGCRRQPEVTARRVWLNDDHARWMIRFYGLGDGNCVELMFGFAGSALAPLARILGDHGMTTQIDSSGDAPPLLLARVRIDGSDGEFDTRCEQSRQAAAATGAELIGIDVEGLPVLEDWP